MGELENGVLVVVDAGDGRQTLRNICVTYEETVVDRFGRAALFEPTELGAFLAFRLRAKHDDVRIHRTEAIDERSDAYRRARDAAVAYENRRHKYTPYRKFAAGTDHPSPEEMDERRLPDGEPTGRRSGRESADERTGRESSDERTGRESSDRDDGDRLVGRRTD